MQPLQQHHLYYDTDCPLCVAYTGAFEKWGIMEKGTRQPFTTLLQQPASQVDAQRARSEIALVHTFTGQAQYGIDAMLHLLLRGMPLLHKIASSQPIHSLLKGLYSFVSYNRKVIAAAPLRSAAESCSPSLHKGWRMAYMAFVVVLSSVVLTAYYSHFDAWLGLWVFTGREWFTSIGQLLWQGSLLWALVPSGRRWDYLGHLMTVSMAGTLLLLPMLALGAIVQVAPIAYMAWFGMVVAYMLYMHSHRVKLLGLPTWLSASWVLYRLLWVAILAG